MRLRLLLLLTCLNLALGFTSAEAQNPDASAGPDRKASLSFNGADMQNGLLRWGGDSHLLHSVNVKAAHIELYRLTERDDIVTALLDRQQTAIAPSESAYFARHKGKPIWSGDVTFDGLINKDLTQKIPLPSGENPPGLYILVASAPNIKVKPSEKGLAPLTAALLLRSDISVRAAHDAEGIHVLAEANNAAARDISVALLDQDHHVLAEAKSDSDGIAFLPQAEDKQNADALLIATTMSGDIAFADAHGDAIDHPVLPALEASIQLPKPFYAPGETVEATLTARDIHGHAVAIPAGGSVQILRPDRSLYAHMEVPAATSGITHVTIPAPALNGAWIFSWQAADDSVRAETILRVTPNKDAPSLAVEADRNILSGDNDVTLKISGVTNEDEPAPYIGGRINVAWTTPSHVFPGWDDYQFGSGGGENTPAEDVTSFITDANGKAQIHLNLKPPPSAASLRAAIINVEADPASGARDPAPLTLPSTPAGVIVGIKPLAENGRFAENSRARFALVALDKAGKRFDADNLSCEVYNEGRSFEWYQADGRWNYRPLQESRRIGGKPLNLKAQGENIIEWPVTSGTYRLDITNQDGNVLARAYFSAGWGPAKAVAAMPARLELKSGTEELHIGSAAHVRFTLDTPSIVSVFIADDHIRKIIHHPGAKGANEVVFTPGKEWGDHILVRINAGDALGEITLPMAGATAKETEAPPAAFDVGDWPPPILTVGDTLEAQLELKNNAAPAGIYKYAFYGPNLKIETTNGSVSLKEEDAKDINLTLHGTVPGTWPVKLEITGPHGFHLNKDWTVDVRSPPQTLDKIYATQLEPEKSWSPLKTKRPGGFLFVAPAPLFEAPHLLELALRSRPIGTTGLAARLEMLRLWHEQIIKAGLLSEQVFTSLRDETALRLLQRQLPDGSFPSVPRSNSDRGGDLIDTAAALMALAHIDRADMEPAVEQANAWLKRQLENNWFDEHERPVRAETYALLAEAGKVDVGDLHYFSDTSADKSLSPIASAQLALAFAKIKDRDAALYWLGRAEIKKDSNLNPLFLPYLADNNFFEARDLIPAMQALAARIAADPSANLWGGAAFLRALAVIEQRQGEWRVTVNGEVQNANGVLVLPNEDKITAIANPNNDAIFIEDAAIAPVSADTKTPGIVRHIYKLDGGEAGNGPYKRGEIYIVTLESAWPDRNGADQLLITEEPGPGFSSLTCMIDGAGSNGEALGWVKALNLSPLSACEKPQGSLFALIEKRDENARNWRAAYLAKASANGIFSRKAAHAYLESEEIAAENAGELIRIRK